MRNPPGLVGTRRLILPNRISSQLEASENSFMGIGGLAYSPMQLALEQLCFVLLHSRCLRPFLRTAFRWTSSSDTGLLISFCFSPQGFNDCLQ
jgi:hypothetical protein